MLWMISLIAKCIYVVSFSWLTLLVCVVCFCIFLSFCYDHLCLVGAEQKPGGDTPSWVGVGAWHGVSIIINFWLYVLEWCSLVSFSLSITLYIYIYIEVIARRTVLGSYMIVIPTICTVRSWINILFDSMKNY